MKKSGIIICILVLVLGLFAACNGAVDEKFFGETKGLYLLEQSEV